MWIWKTHHRVAFVVASFSAQWMLSADAQHSVVRIPEDLHRREMEKTSLFSIGVGVIRNETAEIRHFKDHL